MVPHECKDRIMTACSESKQRMIILLINSTYSHMFQINEDVPQTYQSSPQHYSPLLKAESNLESLTDECKHQMWCAHQKTYIFKKFLIHYNMNDP